MAEGARGRDSSSARSFRHLGDRIEFRGGRIAAGVATFEAPDGERFERDVIRDLSWVGVVPLLEGGEVLLVRQYRGPIDAPLLEIPAGLCDVADEPPEATGARELAEEAGFTATGWQLLARMHNSAGVTDESGLVYLATGLVPVAADRQGPEERHMSLERVALADVPALIAAGELTDAKSLVGLLLALREVGA